MTSQAIARRYAAALFDVAEKSGTGDQVGRDLAELTELVTTHEDLGRLLASPAIPANVKANVVAAVIDAAGGMADEARRVVMMLAERDRLALMGQLADAFGERVREARQIARADVVTATPLSAEARTALAASLGRVTGKTITIHEQVDPAIVGGVVARVGSTVYDGSLTRQLERLRQKLTISP